MRKPSPRTILVVGWVGFLIYAFPGFFGWDSVTQLVQARTGIYTDDHPPAMAALWRLFEHVVRGPLPMLLLITGTFLTGTYRLLARSLTERRAALAAVAILWFPPISTLLAVILKDCLMTGFIAAGLALLDRDDRKRWLGLAWLAAASAMRWNALAATLPLIFFLFRARPGISGWRRYALAFVAWLGVTASAAACNQLLTDDSKHYWYSSHAYQDIAGTLQYARPYSDAELLEIFAGTPLVVERDIQARMRSIYQPWDFRHLRGGDQRIWDFATTEEHRGAVSRAWRTIVFDNPVAYATYRWDLFVILMRFDLATYVNVIVAFMPPHEEAQTLVHSAAYSRVQQQLCDLVTPLSEGLLFDPYVYLALACVMLVLAIAWRDRLAIAILLSGLIYQAAWFVLAPTADYRYSHWLVTMSVLGAVVCFANRRARTIAAASPRQGHSHAE